MIEKVVMPLVIFVKNEEAQFCFFFFWSCSGCLCRKAQGYLSRLSISSILLLSPPPPPPPPPPTEKRVDLLTLLLLTHRGKNNRRSQRASNEPPIQLHNLPETGVHDDCRVVGQVRTLCPAGLHQVQQEENRVRARLYGGRPTPGGGSRGRHRGRG